jgi:acetolactate synthase-1/2/3 large subunit
MAAQEMIGAQMVLRAWSTRAFEHVFRLSRRAVLPIYDELFKQNALRHILVRHAGRPVHAAEATPARPARSAWCW